VVNERLVRAAGTVLLFVLSLVTPTAVAGAAANSAAATAAVADISRIHIDNFGRVNANYYRGGQPNGRDYEDLASIGIKTLVNLTSDDARGEEESMARQAGMKYFQIPMTTHQAPTSAEVSEFLRIVNDPANQPVYVHCVGGRHRTGVMTAAYRMSEDGWNADQAFREMKQYKFGADFLHPEFKDFVYAYRAEAVNANAAEAASTKSVR
jgi:tyrosine-protein phosphatase SIW14